VNKYSNIVTIAEGHERWLEADHPKRPGLKNRDRKDNDLKNYERALECFAAAVGDGEPDLGKLPLELLRIDDGLLGRQLREGSKLLAARSGRQPPSEKTLSNQASCLRAIRNVAIGEHVGRLSVTDALSRRANKQVRNRPHFSTEAWPEALKQEWEAYKDWKLTPMLPPEEARYRKGHVRELTLNTYLRCVNMYVGYFVKELGRGEVTLENLCDPANFVAYLNWYLHATSEGGYCAAHDTGVALATVSRYLVAKGRIGEEVADGRKIWDVFYEHARRIKGVGAQRGLLPDKREVEAWRPWHLLEMAEAIWKSEPVHKGAPNPYRHHMQLISRKRTALLLRLGTESPLRIRNWAEMQWNKNLFKNRQGHWVVRFKGEELKVSHRGFKTNVYEVVYSAEAGEWIERWRAELSKYLGDDFEEHCPYVFIRGDLKGGVDHESLRTQIRGLVLEVSGKDFHPHLIRSIVASNVVNELGGDGIGLAAKLLGDTVKVVMDTYYRPNTDDAMQKYLDICFKNKKKG